MSACELTETYSPAAIDMAPATRPADAGEQIVGLARAGGGDADDQARRRDDAVVGAEHGGAQPADALDEMALEVPWHGAFPYPPVCWSAADRAGPGDDRAVPARVAGLPLSRTDRAID